MLAAVPVFLAVAILTPDFWPLEIPLIVVVGLAVFGLPFAVNSSLHSYLILAYAGSKKAAEDVGFYYAANATGRLMGTLLSGLLYQFGGLLACIVGCLTMLALCSLITFFLPTRVSDKDSASAVQLPAAE